MQLIERIQLPSNQASIVFSSIPNTFTHLLIKLSGRTTASGDFRPGLQLNSTSILESENLYGVGSGSASGVNYTNGRIGFGVDAADQTASTFGSMDFLILDYLSTTRKAILVEAVTENGATSAYHSISGGQSGVTSAITSITLTPPSLNFTQDSAASLFGILVGSDGITTVS